MQIFSQETIQRHKIEVGTAHTFQGDERDIMLISWTIAPNSHSQSLMFLQKPNLFNVAITRARKKIYNFTSKNVQDLPEGLLRNYFEYVRQSIKNDFEFTPDKAVFKNEFEKEVFFEIKNMIQEENLDFDVYSSVNIGGVNADIMVGNLLIECDGVKVLRFIKREWDLNKTIYIEKVRTSLKPQNLPM